MFICIGLNAQNTTSDTVDCNVLSGLEDNSVELDDTLVFADGSKIWTSFYDTLSYYMDSTEIMDSINSVVNDTLAYYYTSTEINDTLANYMDSTETIDSINSIINDTLSYYSQTDSVWIKISTDSISSNTTTRLVMEDTLQINAILDMNEKSIDNIDTLVFDDPDDTEDLKLWQQGTGTLRLYADVLNEYLNIDVFNRQFETSELDFKIVNSSGTSIGVNTNNVEVNGILDLNSNNIIAADTVNADVYILKSIDTLLIYNENDTIYYETSLPQKMGDDFVITNTGGLYYNDISIIDSAEVLDSILAKLIDTADAIRGDIPGISATYGIYYLSATYYNSSGTTPSTGSDTLNVPLTVDYSNGISFETAAGTYQYEEYTITNAGDYIITINIQASTNNETDTWDIIWYNVGTGNVFQFADGNGAKYQCHSASFYFTAGANDKYIMKTNFGNITTIRAMSVVIESR